MAQSDEAWRFVGRWTDTGDCSNVTVLEEGGRFVAPNGATGDWAAVGGRLKLSGPGGVFSWQVHFEDRGNVMVLISTDGSRSTSTRC